MLIKLLAELLVKMLDVVRTTVLLDSDVVFVNGASVVDVVDDKSTLVEDNCVEVELAVLVVLVVLP